MLLAIGVRVIDFGVVLEFLYLSGLCFVVIFGDTVKIGIPVSVDGVVYVVAYVLILSFLLTVACC
jgi:hypothetical protein